MQPPHPMLLLSTQPCWTSSPSFLLVFRTQCCLFDSVPVTFHLTFFFLFFFNKLLQHCLGYFQIQARHGLRWRQYLLYCNDRYRAERQECSVERSVSVSENASFWFWEQLKDECSGMWCWLLGLCFECPIICFIYRLLSVVDLIRLKVVF